jgi:nucleotide-binding universal stress UspA family protein
MRLLVALDGSDKDHAVLSYAAGFARLTGAQVLLVHAVNPWVDPPDATAPFFAERVAEHTARWQAYLQHQAACFAGPAGLAGEPGPAVDVCVARQQQPPGRACEEIADCLARVAREWNADLVLVASKRASGLMGLLLGSTALALLRRSPCPVLVVRPPVEAEAGWRTGAPRQAGDSLAGASAVRPVGGHATRAA